MEPDSEANKGPCDWQGIPWGTRTVSAGGEGKALPLLLQAGAPGVGRWAWMGA